MKLSYIERHKDSYDVNNGGIVIMFKDGTKELNSRKTAKLILFAVQR